MSPADASSASPSDTGRPFWDNAGVPVISRTTVVRLLVVAGLGAAILAGIQLLMGPTHSAEQRFVTVDDDQWQQDPRPAPSPGASTGSLTAQCGRNEAGHRNYDNLITSPGTLGGAHHMHEYVGNVSADAFSTDATLSSAATTCTNGDTSVYFWPVLRLTTSDQSKVHGDSHAGSGVAPPASVLVRYQGNQTSAVLPMPRYLRVTTGDPRAATSSTPTAWAHWSCTGISDRFMRSTRSVRPGSKWCAPSISLEPSARSANRLPHPQGTRRLPGCTRLMPR